MIKVPIIRSAIVSAVTTGLIAIVGLSCSDNVILDEALNTEPSQSSSFVESGDIFIVSGGAVSALATPYPIHKITQWSSSGEYIRTIAASTAPATTFFYGAALSQDASQLFFSVENVDRIEKVNLETMVTTTHILDANLSGATIRAIAVLSDDSVVAAESTTSIEKYDSNQQRVSVGFPIVAVASITSIKPISGDRFVVLFSGNPDNPRVYSNAGALLTSISGLGCTTNCDPYDIVELPDGRFVVSVQAAAFNSLELFDANFVHVGQLYRDPSVLVGPGAMAVLGNGNLLVCSTLLNVCEEIAVSGNTGSRVGSQALIADSSLMRQPTSVVVAP